MDKRVEKKSGFFIDYHDFDQMVEETYGQSFEIVACDELNNYMVKPYRDIDGTLDKGDADNIVRFQKTGDYGISFGAVHARSILNDMVKRGILEPGDYYIEVFW